MRPSLPLSRNVGSCKRFLLVCAQFMTEAISMVGIRSPIGLVVGSCTSHPGVLGSIPKREEPGKTGAPCVKVPGSSRVPSLVRDERTHPHRPRLVVYHSTCRPLSSSPPREQLCNRSCSNKHTHLCLLARTFSEEDSGFLGGLAGQSLKKTFITN